MRLKWQIRTMLAWLLLAMALAGQAQTAAPVKRVPAIQAVAAISTTVAGMDRSVAFYSISFSVCNLFTDCKSHLSLLSQISIGATHYDVLKRGAETYGLPNQQFPQRNLGDAP